jgi:hypothetical protein
MKPQNMETYLEFLENRLKPGSHMPITSGNELDEITSYMIDYREQMFHDLSTEMVNHPYEVLNKLAKLFRIEAICVGLQLMPFHSALKYIVITTTGTFITVLAYVVMHW